MVKLPEPGQFRGMGEWHNFNNFAALSGMSPDEREEYWMQLQDTGFLPTKEVEKT